MIVQAVWKRARVVDNVCRRGLVGTCLEGRAIGTSKAHPTSGQPASQRRRSDLVATPRSAQLISYPHLIRDCSSDISHTHSNILTFTEALLNNIPTVTKARRLTRWTLCPSKETTLRPSGLIELQHSRRRLLNRQLHLDVRVPTLESCYERSCIIPAHGQHGRANDSTPKAQKCPARARRTNV